MLQNGEHQTERLALLNLFAKKKFLRNSLDSEGKWTPFEKKTIAEERRDGDKDYSWFALVGVTLRQRKVKEERTNNA